WFDSTRDDELRFRRGRVLTKISVKARDNLEPTVQPKRIREYRFSYAADPDSGKPRLSSVDVAGEEGAVDELTRPVATYRYGSLTSELNPESPVTFGRSRPVTRPFQSGTAFTEELSTTATSVETLHDFRALDVDVDARRETHALRHLIRDFTGDGLPDLVYKKGATWFLHKNKLTANGPQFSSTPTMWTEPAELHVETVLSFSPETTRHYRWAREAMITKETWSQFLDWNGDGRIDVIDAKGGVDDNHWRVWVNHEGASGDVEWRERQVSIKSIRTYLLSHGMRPIDHSNAFSDAEWPTRVPLERSRSWPRTESYRTVQWICGASGCNEQPDSAQDYDHDWTWHVDTITEWLLADKNSDGFPDFALFAHPGDGSSGYRHEA
ncbi:MAG TPA: hypothetical protein VM820_20675, partial [Vicinamibacterales bacterium]|nr:hypothetical protein [Vicinamibacterales bacterium]